MINYFGEDIRQFYSGAIALVTGASSGIGKELSIQLVELGVTVFGVGRNNEKLQCIVDDTKGLKGQFIPFTMDLSNRDNCEKVKEAFNDKLTRLDILVNNAGISHFSPFEGMDIEDYQYVLNTNLLAPLHITRLFLDLLKKSNRGRIINICSSGAFYGVPFRSIYCASKSGMRTWSQALNLELKRFGIKVLCVAPGSTQTEIFSNSLGSAPKTHRNPGKVAHPKKVSQKIIKTAVSSSGELVISLSDKMILLLSRVIPSVLNKLIKYASASEEEHIYSGRQS